jgi:hypothetical protein
MKKLLFLCIFASLYLTLLPQAFAITFEAAENITITQNLLDDAYIAGGNVVIDADVYGDLYIAGGSVTINSSVKEDLVVGGGKVNVLGDVIGDVRVLGGQVGIYGKVGDDVLIGGGQVDIGKGSQVWGTLVSGAGILTVDGEILEDLRGGLGIFVLNGSVQGDVIVTVEDNISISETANIGGDLKYSALLESNIPKGVVKGETSFNKFDRDTVLQKVTYVFFVRKLLSFASSLVIALLFVLFIPKALTKAAKITKENVLKSFGVGLLSIIGGVIGSIILLISVLGVPIGLIALAGLLVLYYISKVFVCAWLCSYVLDFKKKITRRKLFLYISIAMFAYYLVGLIPFVGWIINMLLFLVGVGSLILMKIDTFQDMRKKNIV